MSQKDVKWCHRNFRGRSMARAKLYGVTGPAICKYFDSNCIRMIEELFKEGHSERSLKSGWLLDSYRSKRL